MIDSLVGNDYSLSLCSGLHSREKKDEETGYLLDENTVENLEQIIIEIFIEKDKLASMGKAEARLDKTEYS